MKNAINIVKLVFGIVGIVFVAVAAVMAAVLWPQLQSGVNLVENEGARALLLVSGMFTLIGVPFIVVAVVLHVVQKRREQLTEELRQFGLCVSGRVTQLEVNRNVSINGRHPVVAVIRCKSPGGREITVKSGNLWETALAEGDLVDVLFDPRDEQKYVVDLGKH